MVRTVGEDAPEQKVIDDVAFYGWHCVNVLAEGKDSPFSYTVGLFHTYQHPELIIFGLPSEVAHQVLNIAAVAIRDNKPINMNQPTDELLEGYSCCFVEVPNNQYAEHVGFARWFYLDDKFPVYQVVFPSRDGRFPWDPSSTDAFRALQPVLGYPMKAL
ncbi:MAG: DUF4262 domain-containing protein [Polaromonas sp.]|nr:DUF4262 domain-containing protein [Polaromonas sp.]